MPKSQIDWVATEMRGLKRRTGKISFKEGYFLSRGGELVGGKFTVDMESIDVTDIPTDEMTARKNVLNHLKSEDFFNTGRFLYATLELTEIRYAKNDSLYLSGNLSIREITRNISFYALHRPGSFIANFTFNRLDWNIAYEGSWADKTLVDKEVGLAIAIVTE